MGDSKLREAQIGEANCWEENHGDQNVEVALDIQNCLALSLRAVVFVKLILSLTFSISCKYVKKANWFVFGFLNSDF